MAYYGFDVGNLTLDEISGSPVTPMQVGVLRDVGLDVEFTEKDLTGGGYLFAIDRARSGGKISGSSKYAQIDGTILASVVGVVGASPGIVGIENEQATIPTSPYTVTVAQGANFNKNLGVNNLTTGLRMTKVASAPTTGQYAVNETTGVYTFAAADAGNKVAFRYEYKVTGGKSYNLPNGLVGQATSYSLHWNASYGGGNIRCRLPKVTVPKLSLAAKSGEYMENNLQFSSVVPIGTNAIEWSSTE